MERGVKRSVSAAIAHPDGKRVLIVQRPADDEDLPNSWGLPAASLKDGESWEEAVRRAGREKLGVELGVGGELNRGGLDRNDYSLEMRLFSARILEGTVKVPQRAPGVTQYHAWRWGDADDLEPGARKGSLCCQLFRTSFQSPIE